MAGFNHSIRFMLQQDKDKNKLTPLRCVVRFNNQRLLFQSGVRIKPSNWYQEPKEMHKPGRLKKSAGFAEYETIKKKLSNVETWVAKAFDKLTNETGQYPEPETLKTYCLLLINNNGIDPNGAIERKQFTLFEYIDHLIENTKQGRRVLSEGQRLSPGTIKAYGSAYGILKKYHKFKYKRPIEFNDIDLEFYTDFKDWAYNVAGLSNNYFGTVIKFLKLCLNEARADELHTNEKYKNRNFVKVKTEVENVYLNKIQLEQLASHDFSDKPKLEKARDLWLIGCYTGLRYSDYTNIQSKNILEKYIEIKTAKTGQVVVIPIIQRLREIMSRYQGKTANGLPPKISNVKLNEYIKDAAKEAGLTEMVTLEKAVGGKKIFVNQPMHALLTTHSARRSFASNMYSLGMPVELIKSVTGHRSDWVFCGG